MATKKRKSERVSSAATPKRIDNANFGEAVVGPGGKLVTKCRTPYGKNDADQCAVSGCKEQMRDFRNRRTGAKGACRMHYMEWIRERDAAIEAGKPAPPAPNEK